jgi:hypothetical protein
VWAMRPGLAKIIQKVYISWYFESPEADFDITENTCCVNYFDTWSPKRVHSLSKGESLHCSTPDSGCEDTSELLSRVAWERLPLMGIHPWVGSKRKTRWIPTTILNSGWMDKCQVCQGSIETISILDPLDIEEANSHIALLYHTVQRHVQSHGWRDASFGQEEDWIEGSLDLRCEVSSTEAFQILSWCDSNNWHALNFRTHPRSFQEVPIVLIVGHRNGY